MADDSCFSTHIRKRVKYYFCFSKGVFFTFGSFFSHAAVEYAFLGYIFVLIQEKTGKLKTAALISTLMECLSPFLASFLARPSFRLMPYLITNLITDASFIAGILILWFIDPPWGIRIIYLALALLVVGSTGVIFASRFLFSYIRFGDDIIDAGNVFDRTAFWQSIARFPGAITGLRISEELDCDHMKPTLKISAIVTIIGYVFLFCGILHYKCQKIERNPGETPDPSQEINQSSQKCSLIMQLLKLLLLFIPLLIYHVVEGAGSTFFYAQVVKLDDHIGKIFFSPAASLFAIQKASGLMTLLLMEILIITKLWKESEWQCAKLILGMFFCFCCCVCSWYVESRRLNSKHMSNLWTVPQFVLLGIAKELVEDGIEDVFFSHVKKSMHLWVSAFSFFLQGLGASLGAIFIVVLGTWIRDDIDKSRLDKYYFLLAMLTILATPFFMCLWKFYAPKIKPKKDDDEGPGLRQLEEGMNTSRSHSLPPTAESPAESTLLSSDQAALLLHSNSDTARSPSNCNFLVPQLCPASEVHISNISIVTQKPKKREEDNDEKMGEVKADSVQSSANYSVDESSSASNSRQELLLSSNLDTTKSSSNSNSSVVKRSLSYPDQAPNPAANVHYQRFHTHPKTNEVGKFINRVLPKFAYNFLGLISLISETRPEESISEEVVG